MFSAPAGLLGGKAPYLGCDPGSFGPGSWEEKPVSCARSQERTYVAGVFAKCGEGQGSGAGNSALSQQGPEQRSSKKESSCLLISTSQTNKPQGVEPTCYFVTKFVALKQLENCGAVREVIPFT